MRGATPRSIHGVVTLSTADPTARALVDAIHGGDVPALEALLATDPGLARARLGGDDLDGMSRSLLHIVTDWPGHFPAGPETVAVLVRAGADVDAPFHGSHAETPLHWAASCGDVAVLDALLDAGANIEAPGSVLGGGPPLSDARGFGNWAAAHRLVERGARTTLVDAATLGLIDRVEELIAPAEHGERCHAFWGACHGGSRPAAARLLANGAELDWLPFWGEAVTPLDAAAREGFPAMVTWLRERGARSAAQVTGC